METIFTQKPSSINSPPVPPPLPQPKNNSKTLIILLSLLTTASIAVTGLLYIQNQQLKQTKPTNQSETQPTAKPATNWKVYTNQDYNYGIKYPTSWYLNESENTPTTVGFWIKKTEGEASGVWVHVKENPDNLSAKEWWKQDAQKLTDYTELLNNTDRRQLSIGGYNAFSVKTTKNWISRPFFNTHFSRNGRIYIISTNLTSGEQLELYNQILSTFKFTDDSSSTADWQTYTDTDYGFEFKYPGEMTATGSRYESDDLVSLFFKKENNQTGSGDIRLLVDSNPEKKDIFTFHGNARFAQSGDPIFTLLDENGKKYDQIILKKTASGQDVYQLNDQYCVRVCHIATFLKNDKVYLFISHNNTKAIQDQVLSTFKFTN